MFTLSRLRKCPVLFSPADWTQADPREKRAAGNDMLNALLDDPVLARLYWAMARMDGETDETFRQFAGIPRLLPFAPGSRFLWQPHSDSERTGDSARGGFGRARVEESGRRGPRVGQGFCGPLLAKDDGWLAAYFDTLSRLTPAQQVYFTDAHRLPRFYDALRGKDINPGPARPVFRPDPGLLLLVTRLQFDSTGQPSVPGNLEVWGQIVQQKSDSKVVRQWAKHSSRWKSPDQLVEAMFAFSRQSSEDGPCPSISCSVPSTAGAQWISDWLLQTVRLLGEKFARYGHQYLIFSEFAGLNDASITRFLASG